MKLSAILEPLVAAGVDAKTILATVKAWEDQHTDALEQRRASDRERQARKRSSHVTSRDVTVTVPSRDAHDTRVEDISSNLEIDGKKEEKKETRKRVASASAPPQLQDFISHLTPILDQDRIDGIVAVRRKKGATFSAYAGKLLAGNLLQCPDPRKAADEMILRNWTGIKSEWMDRQAPSQKPKKRTFADLALEAMNGGAYHGSESLSRRDDNVVSLSTNQPVTRPDDEDFGGGPTISLFRSNLQSF